MNDKEKSSFAVKALEKEYPQAFCMLKHTTPLELLISTRLSAQCTDARVNIVTPSLFGAYKTAYDFANANVKDIQEYIKSCGLYKTKSKDIVSMCKIICEKYDGEVPDNMEDLTSLPGVGRKTANLILGDVFGKPAVVVDTHCIRITSKLGFHNIKDAYKIEKILINLLPPDKSNDFCHRLVLHGRAVCSAKNPKCEKCCLNQICDYFLKNL